MLRLVVTGSRTWDEISYVWDLLDALLEEHGAVALYHGHCGRGLDAIADLWARWRRDEVGPLVELHRVPVDHRLDGTWPAAGQRRNVRMVREFAAVVDAAGARGSAEVHGFWRGNSAGTRGCLDAARRAGFTPAVHRYEEVRAGV
jgi:hypothetical protein